MFNESKHPRDSDGKFTDGNATQTEKTVAAIQKYSDSPARDMREQGIGKTAKLSDFILRVKSGKAKSGETCDLGEITNRARKDIEQLTGQKLNATRHVINADSIRHINKRHGERGESDHTMQSEEDFEQIIDVLKNYDSIELSKDKDGKLKLSSAYKSRNNELAPHLLYKKILNKGEMEVVEAVTDTKKGKLYILTAYKKSRKE